MNSLIFFRAIPGLILGGFLVTSCSKQASPEAKTLADGDAGRSAVSSAALASGVKFCAEHNLPEEECGICHPERALKLKPGEGMKVRLPVNDSARIVGVVMGQPVLGAISESVECYAELSFNQNKVAQIAAPVGGIVQEVEVDLGSKVEEKQTVAKIWSAAIAEAMARAVLTHQTLEREKKLRSERVTAEKDLQEAEAAHRTACQQARTFGFSEEDIEKMRERPNESVMLELRAPFAGEIVERNGVRGALVEAGKALFTLADRSLMWAMVRLPESALARVRVGQTVELHVESLPDQKFMGQLTWIGAEVDERTRMAQARAEVPNPQGLLKARMFVNARIRVRTVAEAVLVPTSAICAIEGKPFVFVRLADDLFEARAVMVGVKSDGQLEVVAGLAAGEPVVVDHGFALKSQWLSSRMGAGCAD